MKTAALSTAPALPSPRALVGAAAVLGVGLVVAGLAAAGVRPRWELLASAGAVIQLHVAAGLIALAIGTALLIGTKGRHLHKALGWTWVVTMATVAVSSLFIQTLHPGRYSFIHLFSGWTIIALPMGVAAIKRRNIHAHRRTMTGLFVGGLVIAGAFTFVPGRLMWHVFLG